jgi:hypothetical protein
MNFSFSTCDRATHLKVVAVALVAAIVIAVGGIHARIGDAGGLAADARTNGTVVKAGKPAVYSTRNDSTIR